MKREADLREGDVQCPALLPHLGGALCCRYVDGHTGKHKTVYENGREWATPGESAE